MTNENYVCRRNCVESLHREMRNDRSVCVSWRALHACVSVCKDGTVFPPITSVRSPVCCQVDLCRTLTQPSSNTIKHGAETRWPTCRTDGRGFSKLNELIIDCHTSSSAAHRQPHHPAHLSHVCPHFTVSASAQPARRRTLHLGAVVSYIKSP